MTDCTACKYAIKTAEHEYVCTADQYDIDNKTCFVPQGLDDAQIEAFMAVNKIAANSDMLSELLNRMDTSPIRL